MHGLHSILFMFKKLKNSGIEWLVMADEDVVFKNPEGIFNLITFMEHNNFMVSGVRDGGVINHRNKNPYAINTFFSILNFNKVVKFFNSKEILKNQYIDEDEFTEDLGQLAFEFDRISLYEPYYCFYFWLRRKGVKILFLDAKMLEEEKDKISNEVFLPDGTSLLIHTWYARSYGNNKKHTARINRILEKADSESNTKYPIIFKDSMFWTETKIRKIFKKIRMKLS